MSLTPLPDAPSRQDPSTFAAKSDALLSALVGFVPEANELQADVASKASSANDSKNAAAISASEALTSKNTAVASASEALTSKNAAAASAGEALTSKNAAAASSGQALSAQNDIHANWQEKLDVAAAQAEAATEQAGAAAAQALLAVAAASASEAARDDAQLFAGIYASTAAGLAATTSGGYFSMPSPDSAEYLILYLNSAGTAVEQKRYPSAAALLATQQANELGTERQRYLDSLRLARVRKPKAAVVVFLGQSLNAPRGTIVQSKSLPIAKMPVGGVSITNWGFFAVNATTTGHWDELASVVDYAEETGQTPGVGLIGTLGGGKFGRIYVGNVAIGARSLEVLMVGGPLNNLWATVQRLCAIAIDDGYDPLVMYDTAHGEANASAGTTEQGYYDLGIAYYGLCQLYAAQAMQKPDYIAPISFTYPVQQNGPNAGENDRAIRRAIKRLAQDLPGAINRGSIYSMPVGSDHVHPSEVGYVLRGEESGYVFRRHFEGGDFWPALHITDVTLSGTTFVATFSAPVVRDATLGVGENLNAALAEDGLEWLDNGVGLAISGLVYSGWKVTGTLASAPTGTLAQQTLRIASQTTTAALSAGAGNVNGSFVRAAGSGWPSLFDPTFTHHQYASSQTFNNVRTA